MRVFCPPDILSLLVLFLLVDSTLAQYKAPLYMGFLMPKKYIRNLTNNQPKPRPNCGSVCPSRVFGGAQQSFDYTTNDQTEQPNGQFNSPVLQFNRFPPQQNFKSGDENQWDKDALNSFQFTIPVPSTTTGRSDVTNFQAKPTYYAVNEPKVVSCCGGGQQTTQQSANGRQLAQPLAQQSMANVLMNVINSQQSNRALQSNKWDAPAQTPSYEQWVQQQPQAGPYVLYSGPQSMNGGQTPPAVYQNGQEYTAMTGKQQFGLPNVEENGQGGYFGTRYVYRVHPLRSPVSSSNGGY